ncbi:hypothetical protein TNCV_4634711 [Trichonephila clavipes]|nr:hypothetical protein TNCV_4634711 [Trichonephila clavipes]
MGRNRKGWPKNKRSKKELGGERWWETRGDVPRVTRLETLSPFGTNMVENTIFVRNLLKKPLGSTILEIFKRLYKGPLKHKGQGGVVKRVLLFAIRETLSVLSSS